MLDYKISILFLNEKSEEPCPRHIKANLFMKDLRYQDDIAAIDNKSDLSVRTRKVRRCSEW